MGTSDCCLGLGVLEFSPVSAAPVVGPRGYKLDPSQLGAALTLCCPGQGRTAIFSAGVTGVGSSLFSAPNLKVGGPPPALSPSTLH